MYDNLIYTGQVRWRGRPRIIWGALKVLWAAMNGWIIGAIDAESVQGAAPALAET